MPPFCYVYKYELRRRSKFRLRRRGPGGQRCRTPPQARHGAGVRRAQLSAPPRGAPKPQTDQDSVAQGALEPPGAVRGNGSASEKGPSGPKEAKVKVTHVGGPSVVCGACAGRRARRDVSKGVRSAHTQAALTGARTTPSARADANGRKEDEPPKRCTRLLNVAAARPSIGAVGACAPSELRVHHHVYSTRIRSVTS